MADEHGPDGVAPPMSAAPTDRQLPSFPNGDAARNSGTSQGDGQLPQSTAADEELSRKVDDVLLSEVCIPPELALWRFALCS